MTKYIFSIPDYVMMSAVLFLTTFASTLIGLYLIESVSIILGALLAGSIPIVIPLAMALLVERMPPAYNRGGEYKIMPIAISYIADGYRLSILSEKQLLNALLSFMMSGIIAFGFSAFNLTILGLGIFVLVLFLFVRLEFFTKIS